MITVNKVRGLGFGGRCVRCEIWRVLPSEDRTVLLPDSLWGDSVTQEKFHYYSKQV